MGDRVAVMRKGEIQQVAPPQELYERPVNLFVGGFIGSPAMNLVEASIERSNGRLAVQVGEHPLTLGEDTLARRPALEAYVGRKVVVGRPPGEPRGRGARARHTRRSAAARGRRAPRAAWLGDRRPFHRRRAARAHRGRARVRARRRSGERGPCGGGRGRRRDHDGRPVRTAFADQERRRRRRRRRDGCAALLRSGNRSRASTRRPGRRHVEQSPTTGKELKDEETMARVRAARWRARVRSRGLRRRTTTGRWRRGQRGRHRRDLDHGASGRPGAGVVRGGGRRLQRAVPERDREVHLGRQQPRAAALDRGGGREPARHRMHRPARPHGGLRRARRASSRSTTSAMRSSTTSASRSPTSGRSTGPSTG